MGTLGKGGARGGHGRYGDIKSCSERATQNSGRYDLNKDDDKNHAVNSRSSIVINLNRILQEIRKIKTTLKNMI